jgi:hypothetical protein
MAFDLVAYNDLDPLGSECADPLQELEQDLWHRLIETYGSNPDDPDRGVGLYGRLSKAEDPQLGRDIQLDFQKDPRVDSVAVTLTYTGLAAGIACQVDIAVVGDAGELGITVVKTTDGTIARVL